jgi:hypothetical protein
MAVTVAMIQLYAKCTVDLFEETERVSSGQFVIDFSN